MVRKWGEHILRSRQYAASAALIIAFLSFFDLPIGWLSTVIIGLVTLQNGPRQGLIIAAWAILPAVAMLCLGQYEIAFINILHYSFVLVFASILRKYHSWMNVLHLGTLLGIVGVVVIHFFSPELPNWLINQLSAIQKEYKGILVFNHPSNDMDILLKSMSLYITGLLAAGIILANLMILFFARWWQSNIVPSISIQKECCNIRMHYLIALLLVGITFGLYLDSALFLNILIVALIPFVLSGLSLLHSFAATKKNGTIFMFIFYILFLFLSPYIVFLLTLMGWLDSFIHFRKRFVIESALEE